MRKKLILLFLLSTFLWGSSTINVQKIEDTYNNFTISYYKDFSNNLSYKDLSKLKFKKTNNLFSFGSINYPVWFKIKIHNPSKEDRELILALNEVFYDEVSLMYEKENALVHKRNGIKVDLAQREINNPNSHFKITVAAQQTTTYYLKIYSLFGTFGELLLFNPDYYNNHIQKESFFYTLYLGAILAIAFYNLFLYFYLKSKIYLYYFGYSFSFGVWAGGLFGGIAFYYIPIQYNYILHATTPLAIIFLMLFSNNVLKIKKNYPRWYKIFTFHIYILSLSVLTIVFSDYFKIGFGAANVIVSYIFFIYFYLAFKQLVSNNKVATLYLVAIGFFLISVGVLSLMTLGILPNTFYVRYSFLAGSFIEIILLSLLLAYRIDLLQKNYQTRLQAEIIKQTQSLNTQNEILTKVLNEKDELLKEMFHRIKNNFQILISLLYIEISKENSKAINQKIENIIKKLFSMSVVHNMLYGKSQTQKIEVKEYFTNLSQHLITKEVDITLEIEEAYLLESIVKNLGLIVNELFTNSIKYAPQELALLITIKMSKVDNKIYFEYIDNSPGYANKKSGYGTEFIQTTLSKLKNVHIDINTSEKIHYKIEFDSL